MSYDRESSDVESNEPSQLGATTNNDKPEIFLNAESDTCEEDNLHGLSISSPSSDVGEKPNSPSVEIANNAASSLDGHEVEESNFNELTLQNNRVNPFNSPKSTKSTSSGEFSQENLLPLGDFTQIEEDTVEEAEKIHPKTSENVKSGKNWMSNDYTAEDNTLQNLELKADQMSNHSLRSDENLTPSDPWIKIEPASDETVSNEASETSSPERVNEYELPSKEYEVPEKPLPVEKLIPLAPLAPFVIDVPGPCEPEDLIEGIIFSANYLGTTQMTSERNPAKNKRMFQAQEAVHRIKAPEGESQPTVQVDLFISTSKLKILNSDTQETMMEHTLRSISYIADVGDLLVVMAKRLTIHEAANQDEAKPTGPQRIICHVLSSPDSHLIAESIGQCFQVAYQQFIQSNCIEPQALTQADYKNILDTQDMYHDDLVHYSKQENVKEIWIDKKKGENMGIAIVESGWGSIIPTVILANLQHGSPMERNGKFGIGDQIMSINNTSLVGLPLTACQSIIKGLRNQTLVKIKIVSCPPVVTVLIKRPDLQHQLGFSVQNGIICSLMRGGIAERGGVRVGHRIIEINNQSVVATPHDKIVQMLVTSVGEIQMKTMPAAMYRLLTGQEQPLYL